MGARVLHKVKGEGEPPPRGGGERGGDHPHCLQTHVTRGDCHVTRRDVTCHVTTHVTRCDVARFPDQDEGAEGVGHEHCLWGGERDKWIYMQENRFFYAFHNHMKQMKL